MKNLARVVAVVMLIVAGLTLLAFGLCVSNMGKS